MFSLSIKNEKDSFLKLTSSADYDVINIDGLSPVSNVLSMQDLSGYDGALYSGSRIGTRNIVITIVIHKNIEVNRIALYKFFKSKENIRIYYKNSLRNVYIDGYVESFECDFFTMSQQCQISIVCPDPYFKEKNEIEITRQETISLFEFPFESPLNKGIVFSEAFDGLRAVIDGGDAVSGIIIVIKALNSYGTAQSPHNITILNSDTKKEMVLNNIWLSQGDEIYINTFKGYKQLYRKHLNTISNKINCLSDPGQWIEIVSGSNNILITDNSDELYGLKVISQAFKYYEGV